MTPEIQAVIDASAKYAKDEELLASLRAQKVQHQNAIADLNAQITDMVQVVLASKAALRAAANNI